MPMRSTLLIPVRVICIRRGATIWRKVSTALQDDLVVSVVNHTIGKVDNDFRVG